MTILLHALDRLLQRLQHVVYKVHLVLDTAAHAHEIVPHARRLPLLLRDTPVRHRAGDLDQTLDAAQALRKRVDLGGLAEALGRLVAALDPEAEHAAAHAVAVLLERDGVLRVRLEARVVYEQDVRGGFEGVGDGGGVLGGFAGAQVERLEAAVGEPGVEGGGDGADGVLEERETLVQLRGVEGCGTHDHVRVAVDVLCNGVDDDVGAVIERVLDVGGEEGVVDDDKDAVLVGDGSHFADVDEGEGGVGG